LQVTPALRPDCKKILSFPAVVKKMNEKLLKEVTESSPKLLRTIIFPKKMHYLTGRLPQPNY
jgi:NIMA (never in mitosis gene a)-related kinase